MLRAITFASAERFPEHRTREEPTSLGWESFSEMGISGVFCEVSNWPSYNVSVSRSKAFETLRIFNEILCNLETWEGALMSACSRTPIWEDVHLRDPDVHHFTGYDYSLWKGRNDVTKPYQECLLHVRIAPWWLQTLTLNGWMTAVPFCLTSSHS